MEGKWKVTHILITLSFSNTSEMSHSSHHIAQKQKQAQNHYFKHKRHTKGDEKENTVFHLITTNAPVPENYILTAV